jgi:nitrilase
MAAPLFETVRVAAIQATPAILEAEACVEKAARMIGEAAAGGARLCVMPEAFVSVFPSNSWAKRAVAFGGRDNAELWERLWQSSVDVPGPLTDRLVQACREHEVELVIGVNERESDRPGSLYNTMLFVDGERVVHKHRKLVPTHQERLFYGAGTGDDLKVVETAAGRVGGLICWENWMPLARWEIYRQGPQIWVAPTGDDSDRWLATMRHIAVESGAFVVAVPQYIPRAAFPADFPVELPKDKEVFGDGGAVIVNPSGEPIAGPLYGEEGIIYADCDLRLGLHAKRVFDVVGHYSARAALGDGGVEAVEEESARPEPGF